MTTNFNFLVLQIFIFNVIFWTSVQGLETSNDFEILSNANVRQCWFKKKSF